MDIFAIFFHTMFGLFILMVIGRVLASTYQWINANLYLYKCNPEAFKQKALDVAASLALIAVALGISFFLGDFIAKLLH